MMKILGVENLIIWMPWVLFQLLTLGSTYGMPFLTHIKEY